MKRMDKSNYAELPFAGHISRRHISHKYIRYSRFDLRGWLARARTLSFFGPTLPRSRREVTRYIDDIFGGSNINSIINQSGCLGERARSDLSAGR